MHHLMVTFYAFDLPSVFMYVRVTWIIVRMRKRLSASYTKLFLLGAIMNACGWLNNLPLYRFIVEPNFFFYYRFIVDSCPFLGNANVLLVGTFYLTQSTVETLLSINRFTAIVWPIKHKLWDSYFFWISAIPLFLNVGMGFIRLPQDVQFTFDNTTNEWSWHHNLSPLRGYLIQLGYGTLMMVISFILNAICLFYVLRLHRVASSIERSLFFVSMLVFLMQMTVLFITAASVAGLAHQLQSVTVYFTDTLAFGPGYFTLILMRPVREEFFFCRRRRHHPAANSSSQGRSPIAFIEA